MSAASGTGRRGTVRVVVNGEEREFPAGATLSDVVAAIATDGRGLAVAVGREVVPRSAWDAFVVAGDARVEVVAAAAGG